MAPPGKRTRKRARAKTARPAPPRTASATAPFLDREYEFGELLVGLEEAIAGHGSAYLVSGPAGIGKTRLAEEVAVHAARADVLVLSGRCPEGGGPAYWPWVQVLRALAGAIGAERIQQLAGRGIRYVATLLPELAGSRARSRESADPPSDNARFYLFDAISALLAGASATRPIFLVLDDLHESDLASLLLLKFLAREIATSRILLVGCHRDRYAGADPQVAELLADVARESRPLPLRGLNQHEIAGWIERTCGFAPESSLSATIRETTDGNPFFVREIVRQLRAGGLPRAGDALGAFEVPAGVHHLVRRMIATVPEETRRALEAAAVIGREFSLTVFAAAAGLPLDASRKALEPAVRAGLVSFDSKQARSATFVHGLIRESLYASLPHEERCRFHRAVADALVAEGDDHLREIAHHHLEAASGGDVSKAVEYARKAGDRALAT
ncbi:MAG: ATP-binding protein, partial [Candidatus Binatia bacterium]